jgi:hypothetical protein
VLVCIEGEKALEKDAILGERKLSSALLVIFGFGLFAESKVDSFERENFS